MKIILWILTKYFFCFLQVIKFLDEGILLQRPEECPSIVYHVMLQCWKLDPKERLAFDRIHKYLTEYCKQLQKSSNPASFDVVNEYEIPLWIPKQTLQYNFILFNCFFSHYLLHDNNIPNGLTFNLLNFLNEIIHLLFLELSSIIFWWVGDIKLLSQKYRTLSDCTGCAAKPSSILVAKTNHLRFQKDKVYYNYYVTGEFYILLGKL